MENLYEKIGEKRINQLIEEFYERVFSSPQISHLFQTDKELIKSKQKAFLTQFLGGPQLYTETYGHPRMRARHLPHAITTDAAQEWLRCMKAAIETLDMPDNLKVALYNCFPPLAGHMINS